MTYRPWYIFSGIRDSTHSISHLNLKFTGVTVSVETDIVADICFARCWIYLDYCSYAYKNEQIDVASVLVEREWYMIDVKYFVPLVEKEQGEKM